MASSAASSTNQPTRITVLISGSGTNLQALTDAISAGKLPNTTIVRVISNRLKAYGLTRARDAGIPTTYHNLKRLEDEALSKHTNNQGGGDGAEAAAAAGGDLLDAEQRSLLKQGARLEFDAQLARIILADKPDLVVCAGFMHILSERLLEPLQEADVDIINLHPGSSFNPFCPRT
jgi:phosphoribosylglycinamide formyltransferase